MGNRACVVFFDADSVSPTVYLHWHGDAVPAWLGELKQRMEGRHCDASYAAARFVGICHGYIAGNLSLGLLSNLYSNEDIRNPGIMADATPGNAGMVVVNTSDFTWKAYGGYLAQNDRRQS